MVTVERHVMEELDRAVASGLPEPPPETPFEVVARMVYDYLQTRSTTRRPVLATTPEDDARLFGGSTDVFAELGGRVSLRRGRSAA